MYVCERPRKSNREITDPEIRESVCMAKSKKKMKLIVNPNSKPLKVAFFLQSIIRKFEEAGYDVDVYKTRGGGDAIEVARRAKESGYYDIVVAGGGDGTVNEVLNGLMPDPIKMGILPLGTSNVLARALCLPLSPLKAADAIVSGVSKKIDVGLANDRYFAIMLSCGYDAYAIEKTSMRVKRFTGKYAYIIAGIKSIYHFRAPRIHIVADGKPMDSDAMIIVISNAHLYGGNYQLTPEAKIDDGIFDVFIYNGTSIWRLFYYGLRVMSHLPLNYRDTIRFRARELYLEANRRVLYQGDGDLFGELPVKVQAIHLALEIVGVKEPAQPGGRLRRLLRH